MKINPIVWIGSCFLSLFSFGQLTISPTTNATTLAQTLAGPNITVNNAILLGAPTQSAYFTYTGNQLESPSGVILSTGNTVNAIGPNDESSSSTSLNQPGDAALTALAGFPTNDRIELKFDFQVQSDEIEFSYIFASEEYNEFVNSAYNDVFAFFISGPGIIGEQNLAVVPTTTTPVTINSINLGSFWQFYRNNENAAITNDVQFDGYTTKMKASKSGLIPCSTYTLRLVIADGSDSSYDSWVLLDESSLVQGNVSVVTNTPTVDNTALEGCIQASFTFNLSQALNYDTEINYTIAGSAINGVDYQGIDNQLIIPSGQTNATIIIDAFADGIPEGQETIYLIYEPSPCALMDTIELFIDDAQPIDYSLDGTDLTCAGNQSGQIDASITGGLQPYILTVIDTEDNAFTYSSNDLPITGLAAGTYTVEVDDIYGCNGDAQVVGAEYDAGQTFLPDGNGNVYTSSLDIAGFGSSTLTDPNQLQSICLNLEHSALGEVEIRLIAPNGTELILKERFNNSDGGHTNLGEPCAIGPVDGGNNDVTPGVGYDYCFNNNPIFGTMVEEKSNYSYTYTDLLGEVLSDNYLPSGSYTPYNNFSQLIGTPLDGTWTIWIKDHNPQDNGYVFNWNISFTNLNSGDIVIINEPIANSINNVITNPACGTNSGAIDITVDGPNQPFTYLWSNGATTEDITGLLAGSYEVTVTNAELCETQASFMVSNATGPVINEVITPESCLNANDGAINITATGDITSYSWSNGETTEDIANLSPGTYSVVVTALNGCVSAKSFTIDAAIPINISALVSNESCGNMEGEIDINVSGGLSPFTYLWSNGATTEDLTDLTQGSYNVSVTDANNCNSTYDYQIINLVGNCALVCDLNISNENIIHETCGNNNGSISLSVFSSNTPVSYEWSNGSTNSSITNLSAGTYTTTITDALGCSLQQTYTIINNSGTLQINNPIITNSTCGYNNGSINISVSGGTGSYTYLWSNGIQNQDLTNLNEGTYSVTVTDQANCSVDASFTISNQTSGGMGLTFQYVVDEICNNNLGSIDINMSNGNYTYLWSNGSTTQDLTNLTEGNYSCVITNSVTLCQLQTPIYTVQNISGDIEVDIVDIDHEYCNQNNGEILIAVSGGVSPYALLWSNGATTMSIFNLNEGTYTCQITDATGCIYNLPGIEIFNTPGDLSISASITEEFCNNNLGEIDLTVTGGVDPITYNWSNGAITQDLTNLSSGAYTYTVTDANQCASSSSLFVTNNSGSLTLSEVLVSQPNCGSNNGAIDITPTGGNGVYTYLWSNGATTQDLTNIPQGVYSVIVTEGSGCTFSETIEVTGKINLNSSIVSNDYCNGNIGSINLNFLNGSFNNYNWSNGAVTEDISNLNAGTYSIHVSSFEGCNFDSTFIITNNSNCYQMCIDTQSSSETGILVDSGSTNGNYSNNENCGFLIQPPCADNITLSFDSFSTSYSDLLRIYDGVDASGILLGTFFDIPSPVTATSGSMFIHFTSNASTVNSGFFATWTTEDVTTLPVASFNASTLNPALGSTVTFTNTSVQGTSYTWDVNGDAVTDFTTLNASNSYNTQGTYIVTLTATNCLGSTSTSQTIEVQGSPIISIDPINTTTYNQSICGTPIVHTFTISNTGTGTLNWTGSNGSFPLSPSSGTINPGSSQTVTINFQSVNNAGNYTYLTNITSNDPINPIITDTVNINQTITCLYTMCNSITTSTQTIGNLSDSGGTTGNYSFNQNCEFLIQPPCADNITLSFSSLYTQVYFDYVRIYDGIDATAPLLGSFSGNNIPNPLTAGSGSMFVRFVSNNATNYSGFNASWTSQQVTGVPTANFTASTLNPSLGSTVNFTNTSIEGNTYTWDVNGDAITDFTTFNASHTFSTPGTYEVTLTASNCYGTSSTTQTIEVQGPPTISLTPSSPSIYNQSDCDLPTVHTFTINNTGVGNLVWTGTNGEFLLSPASGTIPPGSSQNVTVNFPSLDNSGVYNFYNVISSNDPINPSFTDTVIINQTITCLYKMCNTTNSSTQQTGNLSDSGGTTGAYFSNQNCGFKIEPECADFVTLTFSSFQTQPNADFVNIYDGPDGSGTLLASYSGFINPTPVIANSGIMYVEFISNQFNSYNGFLASWTSEQVVEAPTASFTISDANPAFGTPVYFSNTSVAGINYTWDVNGDEITDFETINSSYSYTTPGTYIVTLTATNCLGSSSSSQTIVVQGPPSISLSSTSSTNYTQVDCGDETSHTFTIYNNGFGDLNWEGSNGEFLLNPDTGTIEAGSSQNVIVIFEALDNQGLYTYFNLITSNDPLNPSIVDTVIIEQLSSCLFTICNDTESIQPSGTLTDSGGLLGNYSNNENCQFLVQPECANQLIIDFSYIDLYNSFDTLIIYDGNSSSAPILASYTWSVLTPFTLTTNSGSFFVVFTSNEIYTDMGFELHWSSIIDETFSGQGTVTNVSCETCNDGEIDLTFSNDSDYTYMWSNGETTQDIVNLPSGSYSVLVTSPCSDTTMNFIIQNTTSIDELEDNEFVTVYPNPSTDFATIQWNAKSENKLRLEITDVLGKVIYKSSLQTNGHFDLNVTDFPNGIYYVKINSSHQEFVKKIVVSR